MDLQVARLLATAIALVLLKSAQMKGYLPKLWKTLAYKRETL